LQKASQARQEFEMSLKLQPQQTESYFCLGLLDLDASDLPNATKHFEEALKRDPKHAGALDGLGRVAFQQKRYEASSNYLKLAILSDPSLREAHYYLGMAYGRMGQSQDSQKELAIANDLDREEVQKQHSGLRLLGPEDTK
jgi:tetratricopeptide (TPR) repeat protein